MLTPERLAELKQQQKEQFIAARNAALATGDYAILQLTGRCANGAELDGGVLWHAVVKGFYKAICGAEPGRRSVGWSDWMPDDRHVTCPRCAKKIESQTGKHDQTAT